MTGDTSTKDNAASPGVGLWWRHARNWPGIGGGVILSWCPGSDPERQLPAASPGKSGNCMWVGLSWLHLPGHSPALVSLSSAAAGPPGGGQQSRGEPAQVAWGGVDKEWPFLLRQESDLRAAWSCTEGQGVVGKPLPARWAATSQRQKDTPGSRLDSASDAQRGPGGITSLNPSFHISMKLIISIPGVIIATSR